MPESAVKMMRVVMC